MKKIILLIFILIAIGGCSNSLQNTLWFGVGKNANINITFNDSTCYIYDGRIGKPDTLMSRFKTNKDTIIFSPIEDYVTIPNLLVKGNSLMSEDGSKILFKKK
jgi:hypothetical protein